MDETDNTISIGEHYENNETDHASKAAEVSKSEQSKHATILLKFM